MIRRDYVMRMVQELTQALARVLFLKKAHQYPQAVQEIERVLMKFWNLTSEQIKLLPLDEWIELCRKEEGPMGEKLVGLADLFREQDELLAVAESQATSPADETLPGESERSAALSLGLYLEAVTSPEMVISVDLLAKIDQLIQRTRDVRLPAEVLKRLLRYYETRGMLDKAEDALFDWLD